MFYKRKRFFSILVCLILFAICLFCGCDRLTSGSSNVYQGFSVHYINVGQGDCIFIRFDDGKNMMIDTGDMDKTDKNAKNIKNYLNNYSVNKIDYLVLTHPDQDHVGNAEYLIKEFGVGKAFVPYVTDRLLDCYPSFNKTMDALKSSGAEIIISDCYQYITGQNYSLAFLSPSPKDFINGSYEQFNTMIVPDESASNNLSPIIYLQSCGERFLFTGDVGKDQELFVVNNYELGFYDVVFNRHGITVELEDIDYLKVAHHGADTSSSQQLLDLLRPKNAIISVSGDNFYGHPSSEVLERIKLSNQNANIYRTDIHGTVVVYKNQNENLVVGTSVDN